MNVKELINNYKSGYSLEQPFYTSKEMFDAEWECIFKKHWLFAGNMAQIPKPGDYFLYTLQNDTVIIIRGNNGEVYAHYTPVHIVVPLFVYKRKEMRQN